MKRKPTAFEERVYEAVRRIPKGKVSTYSMVAKIIGCGSNQAIGQALKRNPYAPEVPCHRVISATLAIGGFFGNRAGEAVERKRRMLEEDGVKFAEGDLVAEDCVYSFL